MKELIRESSAVKTKIGFGVGDIFGGGSMMIIGFYYLYFLTDVVLLSPALAGIAILVSKAWDAVTDPIMGVISDRTRTRFGRRRPYFLAGIVLIFLSFFAMWYPVDFTKEMHRFIYILVAYVFFSTVITMVMIPYNALVPELTPDYNERTSLTSFRIFFSGLSSLVCAVVPWEIVKAFKPNIDTGFIVMATAFGLFFALPFIATFLTTRERPEFQQDAMPFSLKRTFIEPFKTPTFVSVLLHVRIRLRGDGYGHVGHHLLHDLLRGKAGRDQLRPRGAAGGSARGHPALLPASASARARRPPLSPRSSSGSAP